MINNDELSKLVIWIEENLRASGRAGLGFIDPRNFKERLFMMQNHCIFGRRGAGKSSLISSLDDSEAVVTIQTNLEDFKDITFPNIIIQVLVCILTHLRNHIENRYPFYMFNGRARRTKKDLAASVARLEKLLEEPDVEDKCVRVKMASERHDSSEQSIGGNFKPVQAGTKTVGSQTDSTESETVRSIQVDKLEDLRKSLTFYKELFQRASELSKGLPIMLVLDDFYFISKSIQPDFIDYFHRLTKGTALFLKLATIKHRSILYKQTGESYIGMELEHDVFPIDMDYTLDNLAELQGFMRKLLDSAACESQANVDINGLFQGYGFTQLCIASGGVPRDFLSLFVKLANKIVNGHINKIGKVEVTEEAIMSLNSKMASMRADSAEEKEILELYLAFIKQLVYTEKRTNAFLIAKDDLTTYPQERQAIKELVDLRLVHMVNSNTSCAPGDGRRYEAYIIDLGLYDNSRPREFTQIEPGFRDDKSRLDMLRASPRIPLKLLHEKYVSTGLQRKLLIQRSSLN